MVAYPFGWFDVLQQQINLIRRYNSNGQTPDAAITKKITEETHFHDYIL